jgi:hypothetical protein
MDPCAIFDESDIEAAGFDHALVGHFQQPHFGWMHTYAGAAIEHEFGNSTSGGAVLVTLADDGTIEREQIELSAPPLHDVEVDLTGAKSTRDVLKRAATALADRAGVVRLRLTGRVAADILVQRDDLVRLATQTDELLLDWQAEVDVHIEELADEQTVRGQFVRDVLATPSLSDQRRQRVLLIGLRALAGTDVLEAPR